VGAIVLLMIVVVVIVALVVVFNRLSLRSRVTRTRWRSTRIQRAAAADVAELRENDGYYDPDGPGLQEDDL